MDNTSYPKVYGLVFMIMRYYPFVGDCLIMVSSTPREATNLNYTPERGIWIQRTKHNYHLIFNNFLSYEVCCNIIETLSYLGVINEEYIRIREMRNDMTLRLSETILTIGVKPRPKFKCWLKNPYTQESGVMIENYLTFYRSVNP